MTMRFRGMDHRRHEDLAWDRVRLSVVIPAYNEIRSAEILLRRVREVRLDIEVIVVDDGSTDGTRDLLVRLRDEGLIDILVFQEVNKARVLRSAPDSSGPPAISSRSKMRIWSMIRMNCQLSCSRSWPGRQMPCTDHAFSAALTASCFSGT